jgi:hypothetical protein
VQRFRHYLKRVLLAIAIAVAVTSFSSIGVYAAFCEGIPTAVCSSSPWPQLHAFTIEFIVRYRLYILVAFLIHLALLLLFFGREIPGELRRVSFKTVLGRVTVLAAMLAAYAYYRMA